MVSIHGDGSSFFCSSRSSIGYIAKWITQLTDNAVPFAFQTFTRCQLYIYIPRLYAQVGRVAFKTPIRFQYYYMLMVYILPKASRNPIPNQF
jgi:hypothetical protein